MVVQGITQFINGYVLNGVYGHAALVEDVRKRSLANATAKRGRFMHSFAYAPISDPSDYTIQRGEIVWDRLGDGGHVKVTGDAQQPFLRSVLNGVSFLDSSGGTSMHDLEKTIRVFGFSRETVKFDGDNVHTRPSGHPVSTLVGRTTTYNTGIENIKPRDMVEWYLPQPNADVAKHYQQIDDGVTKLSKHRIGVATRPMTLPATLGEYFALYPDLRTAWRDFVVFDLGLTDDQFEAMLRAGAFDPFMRALVQEIVDAYGDHALLAYTGAPAGKRMDVLATHPFANIRVAKEIPRTLRPPVTPRGPRTDSLSSQPPEIDNVVAIMSLVSELESPTPAPPVRPTQPPVQPVQPPVPPAQSAKPSSKKTKEPKEPKPSESGAKRYKTLAEDAVAERGNLVQGSANQYFQKPVNADMAFGTYPKRPYPPFTPVDKLIDITLTPAKIDELIGNRTENIKTALVFLQMWYGDIKSQMDAFKRDKESKEASSAIPASAEQYMNEVYNIRKGLYYYRCVIAYEIVYRVFGTPFDDPVVSRYDKTPIDLLLPEDKRPIVSDNIIDSSTIVECIQYLELAGNGRNTVSLM